MKLLTQLNDIYAEFCCTSRWLSVEIKNNQKNCQLICEQAYPSPLACDREESYMHIPRHCANSSASRIGVLVIHGDLRIPSSLAPRDTVAVSRLFRPPSLLCTRSLALNAAHSASCASRSGSPSKRFLFLFIFARSFPYPLYTPLSLFLRSSPHSFSPVSIQSVFF